jgi:dienelactone hydrolase
MNARTILFVLLLALPFVISGCHQAARPALAWQPTHQLQVAGSPPPLGPARGYAATISVSQTDIPLSEGIEQVWIYLPMPLPTGKLPCVLIAPAGSHLFDGMVLGDGDCAEHVPYVQAGFAVVSYSINGPLMSEKPTDQEIVRAAGAFENAEAGVANARIALDFALQRVPQIDPQRIYTAGHSSAATAALLVAAHEPRVKACVAYAPCCDVPARVGDIAQVLHSSYPDFDTFLEWSSPDRNAANIHCPVFLFHADDDTNILTAEVTRFADQLKKTNPNVTFVRCPSGGHHESMILVGIPTAISWLKKL